MTTTISPNKLPNHFLISSCDGGLYDTRKTGWATKPVRANYSRSYSRMQSLAQIKATIRAGEFAWPGGYPMFLITDDGTSLCFDCARKEFKQIAWDWMNRASTGWKVVACEINYEDNDCFCAHCNKQIEPAYSND